LQIGHRTLSMGRLTVQVDPTKLTSLSLRYKSRCPVPVRRVLTTWSGDHKRRAYLQLALFWETLFISFLPRTLSATFNSLAQVNWETHFGHKFAHSFGNSECKIKESCSSRGLGNVRVSRKVTQIKIISVIKSFRRSKSNQL